MEAHIDESSGDEDGAQQASYAQERLPCMCAALCCVALRPGIKGCVCLHAHFASTRALGSVRRAGRRTFHALSLGCGIMTGA